MKALAYALDALAAALPPRAQEPTVDLTATYALDGPRRHVARPMYHAVVRYFPHAAPRPRRPKARVPIEVHALGTSDVAAIERATALLAAPAPEAP